ncbi:hypothetical protein EMCRGX_G020701 [Ephydatia muelleri]|eukprot:Em0016g628a
MFGRRAILPIETEEQCASSSLIEDSDSNDLEIAMNKITDVKKTLYQKDHDNILSAQQRYKRDYDKKHCKGKALDVGSMVLGILSVMEGKVVNCSSVGLDRTKFKRQLVKVFTSY